MTLDFLLRHISSGYAGRPEDESWGLYLKAVTESHGVNSDQVAIHPDPKGPIRHSTGAMYSYAPRRVPVHAVIHDSVFERMRDLFPVYPPKSFFAQEGGWGGGTGSVEEGSPRTPGPPPPPAAGK